MNKDEIKLQKALIESFLPYVNGKELDSLKLKLIEMNEIINNMEEQNNEWNWKNWKGNKWSTS